MANYFSWRVTQYATAVAGVVGFVLMFFLLHETSHPGEKGMDKRLPSEHGWVWLNPFKCLWLLRSPNLLALVMPIYFFIVCYVDVKHNLGFCLVHGYAFRYGLVE